MITACGQHNQHFIVLGVRKAYAVPIIWQRQHSTYFHRICYRTDFTAKWYRHIYRKCTYMNCVRRKLDIYNKLIIL